PEAELIVAHAGIADLAGLAAVFAGKPGVFFDTSAWSPIDLLDFFRQISPEQVVYASDYPYGQQPSSLLIALRTAKAAGFDERQLRDMLAGNASRIADGLPPLEPTSPTGSETFSQPMVFARIHQYISMATPLLWTRQPDTIGVLGLALNACEERNGSEPGELAQIRELLSAGRDVHCPDWERGGGASLRCGLAALADDVQAAVVVLADGPDLSPAAVDRLIERWQAGAGDVLAASYRGERGHPVLLARSAWDT